MLSAFQSFPEVYAGGEAPATIGAVTQGRKSTTPPYMYGWVISRAELYEALNGEPCSWDRLLSRVYVGADRQFYSLWTEKGYDVNEYNPDIPCVRPLGAEYVVIFMACNDSSAIIKSVMENKTYHANCRVCLGNPKAMEMEPAWFRMDIKGLPKGFPNDGTVHPVAIGNVNQ